MAKETVNRSVNIFIQSGEAQKVYDTLIAKEKKLNEELAKTSDPKRIKALNAELSKLQEPISRAAKKLSGELAPSLKDSEALAKRLRNELSREFDPKKAQQLREVNALIKQQKAEINGLSTAQKSMSKESFFGSFLGNLAANGVARLGGMIQGAIEDAKELGKQAQGVENRFKQLNNPLLLAQLRTATKGTVSDLELMKSAIRADNFKLPLNTLATLFEFASRRARETGEDVNYLVESIILGISRKSIPIMDNLGISATQLQKKFKETGDFSKAAFMIVNEELKKMGDNLETDADETDRLSASFSNMKTELGKNLLPILNSITSALLSAVKHLKTFGQYIGEYFNGKSGFGAIAKGALEDPAFQQEIADGAESYVKSFKNLQAEIEKSLGRPLTNSDSDKALLRKTQDAVIKNYQESIADAQKQFAQLEKTASRTNIQELRDLQLMIAKRSQALDQIKALLAPPVKAGPRELTEEELKALQKIMEDYKKLMQELDAMRRVRRAEAISPMEKEIEEMALKFDKLRELAHGKRELLKKIDEEYYEQIFQIQLKYGRQEIAEFERQQKEVKQKMQQWQEKLLGGGVRTSISDRLTGIFDLAAQDRAAKMELDLLRARGARKLALIRKQLADEERAEIEAIYKRANALGASEETIQNMLALIRAKYRAKDRQESLQHFADVANEVGGYLQQAANIVAIFQQMATDRENAELQRDAEMNERKKQNLERRLKKGLITQLEHDREVQRIEREQERRERDLKRRQFKRNQVLSATQATINGFMAVTNALATVQPFYAAVAAAVLAGATAAANVASILSQKPPEYGGGGIYGKGGKTSGRPHSEGGNPILDGYTGRKIGEIEEDEGIINKRSMRDRNQYTVTGTVSQIGSLLNRLHGGVEWESGARLTPAWRMVRPAQINMPNVQRYYALGGLMSSNTASRTVSADNQQSQAAANKEVNDMMVGTLVSINDTIAKTQQTLQDIQENGINAFMKLSNLENQQARMNAIRDDATLKG